MKKIVLTGGGTAGHVTPNLALLPSLQERGYEPEFRMMASHPASCAVTLTSKTFPIRSASSKDMPRRALS